MAFPKHILRREFRRRRDTLEQRNTLSQAICARVRDLPVYQAARVLHCYLPIRSEVDTHTLISDALARGIDVIVPVVRPDAVDLDHSRLASLAVEELEVGFFGTLQPRILQPVQPDVWDLVIVPLLAFDRSGYRLGYGKGYYDRLLASRRTRSIGLAFAVQEALELPHEPHDTPLDWIVTEQDVVVGNDLHLIRPDGERFLSYVELEQQRTHEQAERKRMQLERDRAEQRADALAAKLRELGIDPDAIAGDQSASESMQD